MENKSYTPEELAKLLRVSKLTIYDLIKKGELPAYRVGRQMRVDEKDLQAYKERTKSGKHRSRTVLAADSRYPQSDPLKPEAEEAGPANSISKKAHTVLICGQDPCLDLLAQHMENVMPSTRFMRSYQGSMNGLQALYHRECHIASAHLLDGTTGGYNLSYVQHLLPGESAVVVHLMQRMVGFYTAPGNPNAILDWSDLKRPDLTIVNREKGSGIRVLLDQKIKQAGILPENVRGYAQEVTNHNAAAEAVLQGKADLGIGASGAADLFHLTFIPLQKEQYDVVFLKQDLHRIEAVHRTMQEIASDDFKAKLKAAGYDISKTGTVAGET